MKTSRILVRKAGKFVDVFSGELGFKQKEWTRLLRTNTGLIFVKGVVLSKSDMNEVRKLCGL